jgi:hypothetical protein
VPGLDEHREKSNPETLKTSTVGSMKETRIFLDRFLEHPVKH